MVTSGSLSDALRNSFFLGCVSAIYFWRAKTEERHLRAEDPKYREYFDWMNSHGAITSRFYRLGTALKGRRQVMQVQPAE